MTQKQLVRMTGPALLSTSAATKYTTPASVSTMIRQIQVANTSSSVATFTISIGTDAAGTRIFSGTSVAAHAVYNWYGAITLSETEIIQAFSGTDNVLNLKIFGFEIENGAVITVASGDTDLTWSSFRTNPFDSITAPANWGREHAFNVALVSGGVEMNYPPGLSGGSSPNSYYTSFSSFRALRSVHKYLISTDYYGEAANNKVVHFYNNGGGNICIGGMSGTGTDPMYANFGYQGSESFGGGTMLVGSKSGSDPSWNYRQTQVEFTRNTFHTIDTRLYGNSSGNSDGWIKVLQDGVVIFHVTDVRFTAGDCTWDQWNWSPTYGGGNTVPSPGNFKERTGDGAGFGVELYSGS